ncbi:hypothetical protein [Tumebacillus permanentifrigoris]|nr:hypothetical protein [Tumebacillus permanentifrigoris]
MKKLLAVSISLIAVVVISTTTASIVHSVKVAETIPPDLSSKAITKDWK